MASPSRRLRCKAVIAGRRPSIWRTIDVDPKLSLDALHGVLQIAFGWSEHHLHHFKTASPYSRPRPGEPEPKRNGPRQDDDFFPPAFETFDEHRQIVERFLTDASSPVFYLYDYGEDRGWSFLAA